MVIILTCKLLYLHLDALSWALSLFTHCSGSPRALHTGRHGRGERSGPSQGRQGTSWSPRLHGCLSPHVHWMELSLYFTPLYTPTMQTICKNFSTEFFCLSPLCRLYQWTACLNASIILCACMQYFDILYLRHTPTQKNGMCVKIKSWTFLSIQNIQSLL